MSKLFQSLQYVIKAVNKIRSSSLNDRLFHQLCVTNDEDFNRLLLHTEVRWLSRGNCLIRFYNLFDSVIEFLETKDTELRNKLITSKNDIAYMTDLYKLFNDMNLQLMYRGNGTINDPIRDECEWAQVEVVELTNDGNGLGFNLVGGRSTGVVIKYILPGSAADKDGRLQSGDHVLQVGSVNLRGFTSEQVAAVLRQAGPAVRLLVARPADPAAALCAPIPGTAPAYVNFIACY